MLGRNKGYMNKHKRETIMIGVGLIALSLFLHYLHYLVFRDLHHTLIFLFADIAFIPMEVFFTAFIIEKLLENREKEHRMEKLSMIKGVFFSEFGADLLEEFAKGDDFSVDIKKIDVEKVITILKLKKEMLISFIGNEALMEHEIFSELLMSLFHLLEEFDDRYYNLICNCCDESHIEKDITIAYEQLSRIWVRYMKHLKGDYPQLFLKAMLHNPFDTRSVEEKLKTCGLICKTKN